MGVTLIRYWGSYIKSLRAAQRIANDFVGAVEKGWRTYLVCCQPPEDENWLDPLKRIGIQIVYLPRPSGNFDLKCMVRAYRLCKNLRAQVFHCDNMHTSPLIGAFFAGVPVRIWSKRSMEPAFELGRKPNVRDRLAISLRLSCMLATRTLAVSRAVRDELISRRINRERIRVLYDPYDSNIQIRNRDEARHYFGYDHSEIVITTIGHAIPVKGWDILVRAFSEIAKEAPQTRLLFVGSYSASHEAPFYNKLLQDIERLNLKERIRFTGYLTDISQALASSDIFVLPSRSEGYSYALLEGLYSGLPVISSRVGGAVEAISNGLNGFLFERENHRELTKYLRMLIENSELRKSMAEEAKRSPAIVTMDQYSKNLFNIYESLLEEITDRN